MQSAPLAQLRDLCLALPETTEAGSGEDPTFSVKGQTFAAGHRVGDRPSVWFKATTGTKQRLLKSSPSRYFQPRYVGKHGWMGAWLDEDCDWTQLADLLRDSYRTTAPRPLTDLLTASLPNPIPSHRSRDRVSSVKG